jgi:hypothetical protein
MDLKNQPTPRFTQEAMNTIKEIGDWFIDEEFSYIKFMDVKEHPTFFQDMFWIGWCLER